MGKALNMAFLDPFLVQAVEYGADARALVVCHSRAQLDHRINDLFKQFNKEMARLRFAHSQIEFDGGGVLEFRVIRNADDAHYIRGRCYTYLAYLYGAAPPRRVREELRLRLRSSAIPDVHKNIEHEHRSCGRHRPDDEYKGCNACCVDCGNGSICTCLNYKGN